MLTDTQVRNARPAEKTQRLWDERGLYLEVSPAGGKSWRFKYRVDGKEKRLSLGRYPEVGLADARDRREEARKLIAHGVDPSAQRKAEKESARALQVNSFEVVAREWFVGYSGNWAESHSKVVMRRLEKDIFPWLGDRAIAEIKAPELLEVVRRVERRGALETAHRELNICGQVFRYAVATGRAERDPSRDLRGALPPVKTKHLAAATDPQRVGEILRTIDGYQGGFVVACALRLAPLVFVRPGELRHARWEDIDTEADEWRFQVSKTQTDHIVPLARQASAIFEDLHPLTGRGEWVFPSARTPSRPMSNNAVLAALRTLGIPKEEMSGHGFRATARTLLDEQLGFPVHLIEHQNDR